MEKEFTSGKDAYDVVVIGAGIIGLSTAWFLAQAGKKVAVFDKGAAGAEQSSRNWGWIRSLGRDMAELPLSHRANALWNLLQQRSPAIGYRRCGLLYLAGDERTLGRYEAWLAKARQYEVNAEVKGTQQLDGLLPGARRRWSGALYGPDDGVAEPEMTIKAIIGLLAEASVDLFEHCAVRGFEMKAGKMAAVVTERGTLRCQQVVCCGGAWSRLFCGNAGINLPQLKVHATAFLTTPVNGGPAPAINGVDFTCRPHASGGFVISQLGASQVDIVPDSFRLLPQFFPSWVREHKLFKLRLGKRFFDELAVPRRFSLDAPTPFEQTRTYDPPPTMETVKRALASAQACFPALAEAGVQRAWGGYIDVTPDALPVISSVAGIDNFYLGTGFSAHGFGIGMAAGELLCKLVVDSPDRDRQIEAPFAFTRWRRAAPGRPHGE